MVEPHVTLISSTMNATFSIINDYIDICKSNMQMGTISKLIGTGIFLSYKENICIWDAYQNGTYAGGNMRFRD